MRLHLPKEVRDPRDAADDTAYLHVSPQTISYLDAALRLSFFLLVDNVQRQEARKKKKNLTDSSLHSIEGGGGGED